MNFHPQHLAESGDHTILHIYTSYAGNDMRAGFLPHAGGMMDQPARLMDLFRYLDGVRNRCRAS